MRSHSPPSRLTLRAHARALMVAIALILSLGGCLITAAPLVPDADVAFDARLLGSWAEVGGGARATVAREGTNGYVIEYSEKDGLARYEARLGTLAGHMVLDVWPQPRHGEIPKQYADMMLPAHLAFVLTIAEDEVRLSLLDADVVMRSLRDAGSPLAHTRIGHSTVLHGTTAELRTAFAAHLRRGGALDNPTVFRRTTGD